MFTMNFKIDSKHRTLWHILFFVTLLCGETFLFLHMTSLHHAWIFPRWNDQVQYLTEGYMGYEEVRQHGLLQGIWSSMVKPSPQGMLYAPFSVILFSIFGPFRIVALSLNLLALLCLQVALLVALKQISRSWSLVWLGLGLLLCSDTFVSPLAGSGVDYRLDWMASCAFGVTLSIALLTNGMRTRGWSIAFGLATGLTILLRMITATYFAGIYLSMTAWLLLGLRHEATRSQSLHRLGYLAMAALIATMITLPFIWLNRDWLYSYYWVGHITGAEGNVRADNLGPVRSFQIITEILASRHLQALFLYVWGIIVAVPLLALTIRRARVLSGHLSLPSLGPAFACTLFFFTIPFIILSLHKQKSPVVESVLLPSVTLFGLLLVDFFTRPLTRQWRQWIISSLAVLAMAGGLWHFSSALIRQPHSDDFTADAQKVNALADYLYDTSRAAGLVSPRISVDHITESIDGTVMRVICYERHGTWVPFIMTLPMGITEEPEGKIMAKLAESDFVFLTDHMDGDGNWPYDRQMRRLYPTLLTWSQEHLKKVKQFDLLGRQMTLYQRREIP
jgi:hypothetical protein